MARAKVTIIGAGFVGSTTAHWLAAEDIADVVLLDVNADGAKGKALDLSQSQGVEGFHSRIVAGDDYSLMKDSQVVVVTAGLPRKPGMSRDQLIEVNAQIMAQVAQPIGKWAPESVVIVVTNPMDAMATYMKRILGFPRQRVLGMGGALDSARFRAFLAGELGVSPQQVTGMVVGNHGDQMVPLVSSATVNGLPVTELLPADRIQAIVARTRQAGAEINQLLKTGSAYFAPGAATTQMVRSIILDENQVIPTAVELQGEYGYEGVFVGVPCVLGHGGLKRILVYPFTPEEKQAFHQSVEAIQKLVQALPR